MKTLRSTILASAVAGISALAIPATAGAAINASSTGGVATITAEPGTADDLRVQQSTCNGSSTACNGTQVRIFTATPVIAGVGCKTVGEGNGLAGGTFCTAATTINIDTADGNDDVSIDESSLLTAAWSVNLGDGDDIGESEDTENSTVDGGPGNDTIEGDHLVLGGEGDDDIRGETLSGGEGNDQLSPPKKFSTRDFKLGDFHGDEGNDVLRGSQTAPIDDRLFGDDGKDKLFGGAGRDFLDGGADKDTCDGGPVGDKNKKKADIARNCEKAKDVYVKPEKK